MRLIDADALRERLLDIKATHEKRHNGIGLMATTDALIEVEISPTIDAEPVVRCRECKHRPTDYRDVSGDCTGLDIEFPDDRCPCKCEDGWYNWYPADDWFCGNGEWRDGHATDRR